MVERFANNFPNITKDQSKIFRAFTKTKNIVKYLHLKKSAITADEEVDSDLLKKLRTDPKKLFKTDLSTLGPRVTVIFTLIQIFIIV